MRKSHVNKKFRFAKVTVHVLILRQFLITLYDIILISFSYLRFHTGSPRLLPAAAVPGASRVCTGSRQPTTTCKYVKHAPFHQNHLTRHVCIQLMNGNSVLLFSEVDLTANDIACPPARPSPLLFWKNILLANHYPKLLGSLLL